MPSPLPMDQVQYVLKRVTVGDTKAQILDKFEKKYGRRLNAGTITNIKKRHPDAITKGRELLARESVVSATLLKQKSYQLLEREMDRAIEDASEIDKLRTQLQSGEITRAKFDEEVQKYEKLTINELVKVADSMHAATKGDDPDQGMTPADKAALAAIVAGIQSGNPVNLIQVIKKNQAVG